MTQKDVIALLWERIAQEGTQKAFAEKHGISAAYVGEVLHGTREPGAKVLDALRLEKVVTYRKKERNA